MLISAPAVEPAALRDYASVIQQVIGSQTSRDSSDREVGCSGKGSNAAERDENGKARLFHRDADRRLVLRPAARAAAPLFRPFHGPVRR